MGSIKREPVPPGPIADLFDQLDSLHSQAGRPSMREIAIRAGRGKISSSTVHNIFRSSGPPVGLPRADRQRTRRRRRPGPFLVLWQAAWRAENEQGRGGADPRQRRAPQGRGHRYRRQRNLRSRDRRSSRPGTEARTAYLVDEIPTRNRHFTGREAELELIRENLRTRMSPHMQVIAGIGGIRSRAGSSTSQTSTSTRSSGRSGRTARGSIREALVHAGAATRTPAGVSRPRPDHRRRAG